MAVGWQRAPSDGFFIPTPLFVARSTSRTCSQQEEEEHEKEQEQEGQEGQEQEEREEQEEQEEQGVDQRQISGSQGPI